MTKSERQAAYGLTLCAVALIGFIVFMLSFVMRVPAGHVGVIRSFGAIENTTLTEGGPYWVKPWKSVERISSQTKKVEEPSTVPTKGGLSVDVKAVLVYHLDAAKAPDILRSVGADYENVLVDPYFKNAVRDVCAEYSPESLYTNERQAVEKGILARAKKELGERGFIVEDVMLQDPRLPTVVKERIEAKVGAEQDAIRMESVFKQRELEGKANKRVKELDAEAKVIEASGIAKAQAIIKKDLDDNYLRWAWIEALKESAKHNNATIYVPTGADGMPFFKAVHPGKDK